MHHDVLGDYEERTWNANKDKIIENAEADFLKHESPRGIYIHTYTHTNTHTPPTHDYRECWGRLPQTRAPAWYTHTLTHSLTHHTQTHVAVHDCGLDGDECNYSGTGVEDHDVGTYMKARTQSLAQVSWLPDCASVNCAAEIEVQHHKTAAARQPQVIGREREGSQGERMQYQQTKHTQTKPQLSCATYTTHR